MDEGIPHEGSMTEARGSSEGARERLLAAGWEYRGTSPGLILWRKPKGCGSRYSQEVSLEILELLEKEKNKEEEEEEE